MEIDYLVSNTLLACEYNYQAKELVGGLVKGVSSKMKFTGVGFPLQMDRVLI